MKRSAAFALAVTALLATPGCDDTDVQNRGDELEPGQEVEDLGLERDVEPVRIDTLPWFTGGGTVSFENRTWFIAGEPVYDPAVTYVGEYQGTPLYAEVGVASPYDALYVPLEGDYWQMLEAGEGGPTVEGDGTGEGGGTGQDAPSDTGTAGPQ